MKLRFVKFLTSRENEIEKKEEGGRSTTITCSSATQSARGQSPLPLPFPLLFSFPLIISVLSPSTQLHRPASYHPACRPPRAGRAIFSSYPSPAVSLLPFFFINYRSSKAWRLSRGEAPILPTQLADPAVAGAQLAAPLPLHPIGWPRFSSALMASSLWRVEP